MMKIAQKAREKCLSTAREFNYFRKNYLELSKAVKKEPGTHYREASELKSSASALLSANGNKANISKFRPLSRKAAAESLGYFTGAAICAFLTVVFASNLHPMALVFGAVTYFTARAGIEKASEARIFSRAIDGAKLAFDTASAGVERLTRRK